MLTVKYGTAEQGAQGIPAPSIVSAFGPRAANVAGMTDQTGAHPVVSTLYRRSGSSALRHHYPAIEEYNHDRPVNIAAISPRPGKTEALRLLLDGMIAPGRAEPGNLRYDLWEDQTDSSRFVLDELYLDAEAVAAHRGSSHSSICVGHRRPRRG